MLGVRTQTGVQETLRENEKQAVQKKKQTRHLRQKGRGEKVDHKMLSLVGKFCDNCKMLSLNMIHTTSSNSQFYAWRAKTDMWKQLNSAA
jgi:hypothetical protein